MTGTRTASVQGRTGDPALIVDQATRLRLASRQCVELSRRACEASTALVRDAKALLAHSEVDAERHKSK
jgi:hypothetical protein